MKRRWLEWGVIVVVIGMLLMIYIGRGGATLWFLLLLSSLITVGSLILPFLGPRRVTVRRQFQHSLCTAGENVEVTLHVRFSSLLPVPWMAIEDHFTEGSCRILIFPGVKRSFTCTYYIHDLNRGTCSFNSCSMEWGGLFGWLQASGRVTTEGEDRLVVMPAAWFVENDKLGIGTVANDYAYRDPRITRSPGAKGIEVRDYMSGDPLNRIHWKSSARRGHLQTFLAETENTTELIIVLDRTTSSYQMDLLPLEQRQEGAQRAFEAAVSTAAGWLLTCGGNGDRVELMSDLFPQESLAQHDEISADMLKLSQIQLSEESPSSALFQEARQRIKPGMCVVIISGVFTDKLVHEASLLIELGATVDICCTTPIAFQESIIALGKEQRVTYDHPDNVASAQMLTRLGVRLFAAENGILTFMNGPAVPAFRKEVGRIGNGQQAY